MTRLTTDWISSIEHEIEDYDNELKRKIGIDISGLAAKACGMSEEKFHQNVIKHKVAVVPITSGEGVIGTFSESVAAIMRVVGADAVVTQKTDVAGIAEGISKNAEIIFMADDDEFIALNVMTGAVGDNNIATARGYVTALEAMAGTLKNKDVLVIGCGIVGRKAIDVLKEKEALITVYDKNTERVRSLEHEGISILADAEEIGEFEYIMDATNEGNWLKRDMLAEHVLIATPGVPLSLDAETYFSIRNNVVHDYLQIGAAVMLGLVL